MQQKKPSLLVVQVTEDGDPVGQGASHQPGAITGRELDATFAAFRRSATACLACGSGSYEPELHRVRGELLHARADGGERAAAAAFREAIEVARRQHARLLELRAAMSLARLWQKQGKKDEARDLLGPVYSWFTEGFDTQDLKDAKALLDELA